MILTQDVEDDLLEAFPQYYSREGDVLVYQNGADSQRYAIGVNVYLIGGK